MLAAAVCFVVVPLALWYVVARVVARSPEGAPRRVTWLGATTAASRVRRRMERRPGDPLGRYEDAAVEDSDTGTFI